MVKESGLRVCFKLLNIEHFHKLTITAAQGIVGGIVTLHAQYLVAVAFERPRHPLGADVPHLSATTTAGGVPSEVTLRFIRRASASSTARAMAEAE